MKTGFIPKKITKGTAEPDYKNLTMDYEKT